MFRRVLTSLALVAPLTAACSAEYAPYVPGDEAETFGTAEAAVAACEGDDLQYDFNAFAASLAVAVANEMGRWDVLTDFEVRNGKLELSGTGQTLCGVDGSDCDNVEAMLRLQDDQSSVVPYHSPSIFRSKLAAWYASQESALVELGTAGTQSEGNYRIVSRYSNKRMTVDNGSMSDNARIELWDWTNATGADEWTAEVSGKGHKLVNVRSGKCMELSAGWGTSAIVQRTCSSSSAQVFEFKDIDQGYTGILANNGMAMGVENWSTNNDTRVVTYQWNQYEVNKAWRLEAVNGGGQSNNSGVVNGMYSLVARHSNKPLTVSGSSLNDGAGIVQGGGWGEGEDSRQWYVSKVGDRYQLVNRHSGLCMSVMGNVWSSSSLGQVACANTDAQKFRFETINAGGEVHQGLRAANGKIVTVKDYQTNAGAAVQLVSGGYDQYSQQFRMDDILGGEPHRLEFSHVTNDGPCGDYYWYEINQPNGLPLTAPEESFVQLIFAGGKKALDGADENPFIAQQVSGTLVGIDPSGYMNGGSTSSSGSCVSSDILYDKSRRASGACCIKYNGQYGSFRQSFWSASTFICN